MKSNLKKAQIYEAAARLFQEKGYVAASMRDLAERVELRASSLYSHIGSKEEILKDICFSNARHFLSGMAEVEQKNSSPLEQITDLLRLHIRIALEEPTSVTVFNDEWRHLSEPHLSEFLNMRRDYEQRFRSIITAGIEKGELKKLSAPIILNTLLSSLRWLHDWYKPHKTVQAEEVEREILELLLTGIKA